MLDKLFPRNNKKPAPHPPFRAIFATGRLAEYRGALPTTRSYQIEHWLFVDRLTEARAKTLVAERFRGVAGIERPTHTIYCLVFLLRDKGAARCLFNVYLDLSGIPPALSDWVAAKTTKALARSLNDAQEVCFLVRCNGRSEFPWCLGDLSLDDYWLAETGKFYRFYLRQARAESN